jgi:hypothetical protein
LADHVPLHSWSSYTRSIEVRKRPNTGPLDWGREPRVIGAACRAEWCRTLCRQGTVAPALRIEYNGIGDHSLLRLEDSRLTGLRNADVRPTSQLTAPGCCQAAATRHRRLPPSSARTQNGRKSVGLLLSLRRSASAAPCWAWCSAIRSASPH